MSLQEIIVLVIVLFCVFYVGKHIAFYFKNANSNKNPCDSCSSGCELRNMMNKKKEECKKPTTKKG